jgi:hypothetical protein
MIFGGLSSDVNECARFVVVLLFMLNKLMLPQKVLPAIAGWTAQHQAQTVLSRLGWPLDPVSAHLAAATCMVFPVGFPVFPCCVFFMAITSTMIIGDAEAERSNKQVHQVLPQYCQSPSG